MRKLPWLLLATSFAVGCGRTPEPDSNGRLPGEVAILAFEAARDGDYETANGFATDAFREDEERARAEAVATKREIDPSSSWIYRTQNFERNVDGYEVGAERYTNLGHYEVLVEPVFTDGRRGKRIGVLFGLEDGVWKLSTLEELNAAKEEREK